MNLIFIGKFLFIGIHYFFDYLLFTADIVIDNSIIGLKTSNIFKQNPVYIGFYIASETIDVSEICYYDHPLGHINVFHLWMRL